MQHTKTKLSRIPNRMLEFKKKFRYQNKVLAKLLGIRNQHVLTRWEEGTAVPNLEHFLLVLDLYNATPDELYGEYMQHLRTKARATFKKFTCPIFPNQVEKNESNVTFDNDNVNNNIKR